MTLLVRSAAAADIEEAYSWYRNRAAKLGDQFLVEVDRALRRITTNPEAYPVLHRDTRRILLRRFPYGLFDRLYGDTILIVGCFHARRDPRRWRIRR